MFMNISAFIRLYLITRSYSVFITCHSVRWIPNLYELQQKEVGTVSGRVVTIVYYVVLQNVPSELHPKVRNHGEGPY